MQNNDHLNILKVWVHMKKLEKFQCEFCNKTYNSVDKAMLCEHNHLTITDDYIIVDLGHTKRKYNVVKEEQCKLTDDEYHTLVVGSRAG